MYSPAAVECISIIYNLTHDNIDLDVLDRVVVLTTLPKGITLGGRAHYHSAI